MTPPTKIEGAAGLIEEQEEPVPFISVSHASPLTDEQIASLQERLTSVYASVTNADPAAVHVIVQAVPAHRWAVGGVGLAKKNE